MKNHTPGLVEGRVLDSQGTPISEARVFFKGGPAPLPDLAALTNEQGIFNLSVPVTGTYTIQCVADGFAPRDVSVDVEAGQKRSVEIALEKE